MPGPPATSTRQPDRGLATSTRMVLPSTGRPGSPPKWPLKGRAPRQWSKLWALPQAVAWEQLHHDRTVARYVQLLGRVEDVADAPAALHAQLTALEDRLGLTPRAMLYLRWSIASATPGAENVGAGDEEEGDATRPDELDNPELEGGATVTNLDQRRELYS